jgi:hypothetical protein
VGSDKRQLVFAEPGDIDVLLARRSVSATGPFAARNADDEAGGKRRCNGPE